MVENFSLFNYVGNKKKTRINNNILFVLNEITFRILNFFYILFFFFYLKQTLFWLFILLLLLLFICKSYILKICLQRYLF